MTKAGLPRRLAVLGLSAVALTALTACGSGISKADYDAAKQQVTDKEQQVTTLQKQVTDLQGQLVAKTTEAANLQNQVKSTGQTLLVAWDIVRGSRNVTEGTRLLRWPRRGQGLAGHLRGAGQAPGPLAPHAQACPARRAF